MNVNEIFKNFNQITLMNFIRIKILKQILWTMTGVNNHL
jgi:hypothetical protein